MNEENSQALTNNNLLGPVMVDPSLLVSNYYLHRLHEYRGEFYFPDSFEKILLAKKEDKYSEDFDYFRGYLRTKSKLKLIGKVIDKKNVHSFSQDDVEIYPDIMVSYSKKLNELYLPEDVKNVYQEELLFLLTHSRIASRLKRTFEVFGELFPLVDLTRSVPPELKAVVDGMKDFSNWIAFLVDMNMTASPLHAASVSLTIQGIRMFIIDPPIKNTQSFNISL